MPRSPAPPERDPIAPPNISDAEWDLLECLWRLEHATARRAAEHLAPSRAWAYSTVKTMLDRMVEKGLVRGRRVGPVWEYAAAVAPEQARRSAWQRFVGSVFGGALAPALNFVVADARLTPAERDRLLALIGDSHTPGPVAAPAAGSRQGSDPTRARSRTTRKEKSR
ncbi:MAG: BlaI/MecI/CopY family transcriptional regulator [Phycisphaerae bacterium]|nr:BlaI/MecI/CopY family transcriptional regulator [Phycisphaerae bacterium]